MKKFYDKSWAIRALLLGIGDIIVIALSMFLALWFRFDFQYSKIPGIYLHYITMYFPIHIICTLAIFFICRLYHSLWKYASIGELWYLLAGNLMSMGVQLVGMELFGMRMPFSYYIFEPFMQMSLVTLLRFSYRLTRFMSRNFSRGQKEHYTMLIGAGESGRVILNELQKSDHLHGKARCIVDDNPQKQGKYINGVLIAGGRNEIQKLVDKYEIQDIIFAIPTAPAAEKKKILQICKETGCKVLTLPGIYQLIKGEVSVSQLRPVEIEDLLGREAVKVSLEEIMDYVKNQVVLVTGGGGSIGSELCRQIASHDPRHLIIFDIYENNAYDIQQELKRTYPDLKLTTLIGSVRNTHRIDALFEQYKPDIVYHAAAHKHVPLMEDSPNEAVKNNVFGTLNTARAAGRNGTKRFILISTDKAVNPTIMMGATKRMCEMIIQAMYHKFPGTTFAAVRFGNVLGSNGSVIPLFRQQIKNGGPVTVTHPDIIRYFMTIPEAVSLVLQAGTYAKGGEIFVLDMGEPVKIADMARNLIKLSGFEPDVDIKIQYTGLRPGEKLYEELLMDEEGLQDTQNHLIHVGRPLRFDEDKFWEQLRELKIVAYQDTDEIWMKVKEIVPTYRLPEEKKMLEEAAVGMEGNTNC